LYVFSPEVASCRYRIPHPSKPELHLRIELVAGTSTAVTPADVLKKAVNDIMSIFEGVKDAKTVEMDTQRPPSSLGMRTTDADLPPEVPADKILSELNVLNILLV